MTGESAASANNHGAVNQAGFTKPLCQFHAQKVNVPEVARHGRPGLTEPAAFQ
jgi:hypothetical protein